jgi:REP element-mobilizing transposase RayT
MFNLELMIMPAYLQHIDSENLDRQLASASAIGFILIAEGKVAASAGSLSLDGIRAAAAAMHRYWPATFSHEVNRTVCLSLDQKFVFLYAKYLPEREALLGLVFPMQTPLIRIRLDMTHFMRLFMERTPSGGDMDEGLEQSLQSIDIIGPMPDPELHQLPDQWELENKDVSEDLHVTENNLSANQNNQSISPEPEPWLDATDALPEKPTAVSDWQPLKEERPQDEDLVSILQGKYDNRENFNLGDISPGSETGNGQTDALEEPVLLEDTQPCRVEKTEQPEDYQAVSNVTFYLVPADPRHFLIGELSTWLKRWMPALCETYGWQLRFLSVRPDYIKWTLTDFPEALIRKMLQVVRQHTSGRIFHVFPNLKTDNAGGDFWAPGYLVDTQDREFTTQALMIHLAAHRLDVQPPKN